MICYTLNVNFDKKICSNLNFLKKFGGRVTKILFTEFTCQCENQVFFSFDIYHGVLYRNVIVAYSQSFYSSRNHFDTWISKYWLSKKFPLNIPRGKIVSRVWGMTNFFRLYGREWYDPNPGRFGESLLLPNHPLPSSLSPGLGFYLAHLPRKTCGCALCTLKCKPWLANDQLNN